MKNLLLIIWNFFFEKFWVKFALIAFTVLLSFFNWEGWPFVFLLALFIGWMFIKKPKA
jgi:hypothetical protein